MKYTIFNDLFKIISIFILSISNSYAGGGGSSPPPDKCNASNVNNDAYCEPYSPSLPSWEEIKAQSAIDKQGIASFTLKFDKISDDYYPMDVNQFADYISCNPADGATRYVKSGYVYRHQSITGNYCKKWIIGISKNYMNSTIQSEYKNGNPKENFDIKLFCDEVETIKSLRIPYYYFKGMFNWVKNTSINAGSSMLPSHHYVCRDGIVREGDGQCKVGTEYKLKTISRKYSYDCSYEKCSTSCGISNDCYRAGVEEICDKTCTTSCYTVDKTCTDTKYYLSNDSTYDTYKIDIKKYNVNICHKPIIKKGIKMDIKYDPNLIHEINN